MLGTTLDEIPRFITKKWVKFHDQSVSVDDRYKPNKRIRFKTSILRSDLCDYSDASIVVKVKITVTDQDNDAYEKELTLTNVAPFSSCILKINNTLIDNAEDLNIVMPMYNLLEYRKKYVKTTWIFWNYYRDEPNEESTGDGNGPTKYSNRNSKSFDYKTSIAGTLEGDNTEKEAEIVVPLKYFSEFCRTLDTPLVNCETNLILTWSENCVLTSKAQRQKFIGTGSDENPQFGEINNLTNATLKITETKLYLPVATLSTKDDNNFLEQLQFKRIIKWNEYRSEMTYQAKTSHLNHLIDPTFTKIDILFVLLFENEENRTSFSKYYVPKLETKDFHVLIDEKSFLMCQWKTKNLWKNYEH